MLRELVVGKMLTVRLTSKEALDLYRQANEGDDPHDLVILDLTIIAGMGGKRR